MNEKNRVDTRLALLDDVPLSPNEITAIRSEVEDLDRIVAELEEFAEGTPWISLQDQPSGKMC